MPTLTVSRLDRAHNVRVKGDDRIVRYDVRGLPYGQKATIFRFDDGWQILQATYDVSGDFEGKYTSAEHAISALQAELARRDHRKPGEADDVAAGFEDPAANIDEP